MNVILVSFLCTPILNDMLTSRTILSFLLLFFVSQLYAQMPRTLSKAEKVYGLSKFWQEVNYNFVYLDRVDRDQWDAEYKRLISAVQETEDDYEYYRLLQKFCAMLKDGHTNVFLPDAVQENLYNTYFGPYRFFLDYVDNKIIITHVNLSKKDEIPIGTEVVQVNGQKAEEYLETQVLPYISSSTEYILKEYAVEHLLQAPRGTHFDLVLKLPDGTLKELALNHTETTEGEIYPPFEDREILAFKWLKEGMAYLELNTFGNPKEDTLFLNILPELYKAKNLIIDLRHNNGGNTSIGREILKYLTNDEVLYGARSQSRLHIPAYKAWGEWLEPKDTVNDDWAKQAFLSYRDQFYHDFPYQADTIHPDKKRLVVPTVLLIGHNTASAAEDFLIYADNQAHMVKIGSPTFGSTGQSYFFDLPGGGSARVCTKKDIYPDGREFVGYGIQPDIQVEKTLQDYLEHRDPVLERAIDYLEKQK